MEISEIKFKIKQKIEIKFNVHIGQPIYNLVLTFNRRFRKFEQPSTAELLKNYNTENYKILEEIEED